MLRNILGPVFNFNLDQFLTLEVCYFFVCFVLLKPLICIVLSAKHAKLKETQKRKNTICEHTCANCSCQNIRFFFVSSAFFIFAVLGISMFFRDVFDMFPK